MPPVNTIRLITRAFLLIALLMGAAQVSWANRCEESLNGKAEVRAGYVLPAVVQNSMKRYGLSKAEMDQLFANRRSKPIKDLVNNEAGNKYWFISKTNAGESFKITVAGHHGQIFVTYVGRTTPAMENVFFKAQSQGVEDSVHDLLRPIKGYRQVTVEAHIAVKILHKHGLTIEQVLRAAQSFDGRYYDWDVFNGVASERFKIKGQLGSKPLRIVFSIEPQTRKLHLLTAFVPREFISE